MTDRNADPGIASALGYLKPIYLDHHATTPVDPRVAKLVLHVMTDVFGNANSVEHAFGEAAANLVVAARESVATLVGAVSPDIRFTSGATEAIRLAVAHAFAKRRGEVFRVGLTRVEHSAVIDSVNLVSRAGATEIRWIDVDSRARLVPDSLEAAFVSGVDLVCLMAANNEVGTIYPIEEVAAYCCANDVAILVDATQAAGRIELQARQWGLDYLVLSAHKLYGPKGVGALVSPDAHKETFDLISGREGTPNVPGIVGFGEACRLRRLEMSEDEPRIVALRDRLESALINAIPSLVVNGDLDRRLSHNLHISSPGVPNDAVVARLRRRVAISTGAACAAGAQTPSHVLRAMGLPEDIQEGALRIGLGKFNTCDEIDRAISEIVHAIKAVEESVR